MHSDIELIEKGIKKDAEAMQEKFAKEVADEVLYEVSDIINQLDNSKSINQIKTKLEKIEKYLEKLRVDAILENIGVVKEQVESGKGEIQEFGKVIAEQSESIQNIEEWILAIDFKIKAFRDEMGEDFFQGIIEHHECLEKMYENVNQKEDDILNGVEKIDAIAQGGFQNEEKRCLLSDINEFKIKMKWLFVLNGVSVASIIGMFFYLLFK